MNVRELIVLLEDLENEEGRVSLSAGFTGVYLTVDDVDVLSSRDL